MSKEEVEKLELQLERAVRSRLQHFKDQADSLTLASVRRLLENDLGLEKFALDSHKRFIRLSLEKQMSDADDCNSKTATEDEDKDVQVSKEEAIMLPKQHDAKNSSKKASTGDEDMMEDSPIMGVLTPKSEADTQEPSVSESRIEKAILDRADHFLANSENITLAGVRRLLEEDLGLDKNTLDPFKKFISKNIDQILDPPKEAKPVKEVKKKASAQVKKSEKISSEENSDASGDESASGGESDETEDKVRSRKKPAPRKITKKLEEPKKRKMSKEIDDVSSKKPKKIVKRQKVESNDSDGDGSVSEDGQSQSSVGKQSERKETPAPVYGKKVENLKSIIKACGMSVPPVIYKKAKQEPDNKREAFIVKELEGILSREGLSKNPSEKEIKDCKKRKETARELEGIDMSNIISSSRRRSTFSFVTIPKPEVRAKAKKVEGKDSKNKNKDNDHNDDKEEDEDKKEDDEDINEEEKKEDEEEKTEKKKKKEDAEDVEGDEEEEEEEEEDDDDDEEEEDEEDESEGFNEDDDDADSD